MKYSRYEYERSYLLSDVPKFFEKIETKQITDKYVEGTRIRLRKVLSNEEEIYKLTKKEALTPEKKGVLKINTIRLSKDEYEIMNALKGFIVKKKRTIIGVNKVRIGIDEIRLKSEILYIAEIEFKDEVTMNSFEMPLNYEREITSDKHINGYKIAKKYAESNLL